jgi:hypothetical protein
VQLLVPAQQEAAHLRARLRPRLPKHKHHSPPIHMDLLWTWQQGLAQIQRARVRLSLVQLVHLQSKAC